MGVLYLLIEIVFDMLVLVIGGFIALGAKDNFQKRYWGVMSFCIGLVFLWENVGWLTIVSETPAYRFSDLLNMEKMLKWYIPASIVCLFPVASLRPGYLSAFKVLSFMLLPIVVTTVGICYSGFNGHFTPVTSLSQILSNFGNTDIRLRCGIFLMTVVTPLFPAVYPVISPKTGRKINRRMYLFLGFMFLFLIIYILFSLSVNEFIFNLFGITAVVFSLVFSVEYLLYENPFSSHGGESRAREEAADGPLPAENAGTRLHELFCRIEETLKRDHLFTDKDYGLKDLARDMDEREAVLSEAIKAAGFTSFREYLCDLRLEYFKRQAENRPGKYVKELIFECGFTSRSTFYRNFTKRFGESPSRYMEK